MDITIISKTIADVAKFEILLYWTKMKRTKTEPMFVAVPSNMSVYVGSTILLECTVTDPETTDIHWLKDGSPFAYSSDDNEEEAEGAGQGAEEYDTDEYSNLEGRNRHKMAPSGALQIFNAMSHDSGRYSCVATNPTGGTAQVNAYLRVTGL